jgi:hypothetical protein
LGDHGFAEESPRLSGGALLFRPDIFDQIVTTTKLPAYDVISITSQNTAELIAKRQTG